MRILLLSSFLPYPLYTGGHIRLYNLIKELSKKHEITLLCEKRDYQSDKDISEVKKICTKVIAVKRRKQWSLKNMLKTSCSSYPFLVVGHINPEMQDKAKELLTEKNFDLIHVETFYVAQNLPKVSIPVVLIDHNVEYLVYGRYAKTFPIFTRPVLHLDALKMKHWEKYFWKKATKLVAVSEEEKILMERGDVSVVPNGVNIKDFRMDSSKANSSEKTILFIGDFRWLQNKDSASWILKEIWPEISSKSETEGSKSHVKLWIVGRNIPNSIKKLSNNQSVIFDENAPANTSKIFSKADVLLAPIRAGGGTSFKILEAMASGVPVVTTSLGIEGITARDRQEVMIGNSSSELAKKILEILQDKNLYQEIAKNGRKLIEDKYDWEKIAKRLEEVYYSAVKK